MANKKNFAEPETLTPETREAPAGIYVHIPFCQTKCPYCSFVSFPGKGAELKTNYIRALLKQAKEMAAHSWCRSRKFHSLFVGGGTPSTMEPESLAHYIASCLEMFEFIPMRNNEPEVTLEVNPNTVTREMLDIFRRAGVNRLSIGMQAFSERMLKNIGRSHSVQDNLQAYESARQAGFTNINLDLMYSLPGQDTETWEKTLQQATALSPEHLSVYELTIEPGTPFAERSWNDPLRLPHEDATIIMFEQAREILSIYGYNHYETSNYARSGFTCIHNSNYWENGSYLGLGAGAVSCFSGVRIKNEEQPETFINLLNNNRTPYQEAEFLPLPARFRETVVMGLRLTAGVSIQQLQERFGMSPQEHYGELLQKLIGNNLLEVKDNRLRLTQRGLLLANRVMEDLV